MSDDQSTLVTTIADGLKRFTRQRVDVQAQAPVVFPQKPAPVVQISEAQSPRSANPWIAQDPARPPMSQFYQNGAGGGFLGQFTVIVANFGSGYVAGVYINSKLTSDIGYSDTIALTGTLSSANPDKTDPGWKSTSTTDRFWIEIPIDDATVFPFSISGASVQNLADGGTWSGGEVENDGMTPPSQTFARITIAEMDADVNGNPYNKLQDINSALSIQYGYYASQPSGGGSPSTIFAAYPLPP